MHQSTVPQAVNETRPAFQEYQHQFVDYLRHQTINKALPETLPQRTRVYTRLLYNKIEGSLRNCFPITRELLGPEQWRQLVQLFIREHRCQSPLYREIPDEFIDYLMNESPQRELPEFIADLAHYEWMELVLETAKPAQTDRFFPVKGDLSTIIPALNPVLYLLHYRYPVQSIKAADEHWKNWPTNLNAYTQEAIILAGLRDRDYKIHFVELNPVTAHLIELLQENLHTGEQALLRLAAEMHYSDPDSILPFGINILQQLEEQQIIIGARNEP